ncbi:MAG: crotonase/enoyl-CoA hydratase family protein [Acidimicrobiia bacterium]|nr:crotonase/enoyl-CoA hydratase family protein [Acidimicrobiia bacterium]MDH5237871.1 crotonase/enoyl-CoA hydratase family protein [Acidimicrobiia bacterium]
MTETDVPAVITERRDRVMIITLNRPDQMNAINGAIASGLWAAVQELNTDPGLTAGVLTGNGRGFCSGMDLKAFAKGEDIGDMIHFVQHGAEKPLICAIEGFALAGGLELALSCDLLVAAKGVKLGIPEVKVGLFAAGGGLMRLPSRVGYSKAMEMAVTGDPITADEGAQFGLIARLVEPGEAVATAIELAERIAENAPLGVAASKAIVRATQGATEEELWAFQGPLQGSVFTSDDAREGPAAFAEKRDPDWSGT